MHYLKTPGAYFNEFDPKAAAWLRELIRQGHIAPGDVDERSIEDVTPADLAGYTQCHFFAGIGVWSYALRQAGWADDRPVWTGSCPCQPFSAAGKGAGFADERHLWPAFHHLIRECCPSVVFGEQVASKDGLGWLDLVQADLEGSGYACGAVDLCAAGVGAPHIRQRLWWVGERLDNAAGARHDRALARAEGTTRDARSGHWGGSSDGGLADADSQRRDGIDALLRQEQGNPVEAAGSSEASGMADAKHERLAGCISGLGKELGAESSRQTGHDAGCCTPDTGRTSPTNGHWRDADWLYCRDGKWRPVEPGTFPLAHGAAERVGRLRGYGNAIVAPAAQAFIEAYEESRAGRVRLMSPMTTDKTDEGVFG